MNQYTQSVCLFFYPNIDLNLFFPQRSYTGNSKKRNVIKLVPMNPDVSLAEKDVLVRSLFRNDDKLMTKVRSEEFQEILCTDPTPVEGEAKVVQYFNNEKRTNYIFCVKILLSIGDC